jgi:tRNA pseudouridine65 synthase/23S rRNA pseudouridine1911/1915/1917 synthase
LKVIETHIVPAINEKIRLQEYAHSIFNSITSKSGIKKAIKRQEVLLNGNPGKTSDWVEQHQKIELLEPAANTKKIFELKLEVVYEDEFLAVINKPSGYPTSGNYFKTIENALPFNLNNSKELDALPAPIPVHRLDNPTSGLLLVAKTRKVQMELHLAFENKEIKKSYTAIVHGAHPDFAVYSGEIAKKPSLTLVKKLTEIERKGELFSFLEVKPQTGRTHQIRIHLSEKGFPIVGDKEYGRTDEQFLKKGLYLASTGLCFSHPVKLEKKYFNVPAPKKFIKF